MTTFRPHAVELDGGILQKSTRIDAAGAHPTPAGVGDYHFFVDLIEDDGSRIGMWSGFDYSTAVVEAEHVRRAFEITEPVRDKLAEGTP